MTPWTVACQVSVHGIIQARVLEGAAISFSRGERLKAVQILDRNAGSGRKLKITEGKEVILQPKKKSRGDLQY